MRLLEPELVSQLHPTLNVFDVINVNNELFVPIKTKVWWICDKGHPWETRILNRVNGSACHICTNRIILQGYNDFATVYSKIAAEWHPTLNGDLKPTQIPPRFGKVVWWLGECNHEWQASPANRKYTSCPFCKGVEVYKGLNDLATINPELASEWHPTKNGNLTPDQVRPSSHKPIWWLGKCGHDWRIRVDNRHIGGTSCPFCANQEVWIGFNDLGTKNSKVAKEWHPTKNHPFTPQDFTYRSDFKAWWQCLKGHEWKTTVDKRSSFRECPDCSAKIYTSKAEIAISGWLKTFGLDVKTTVRSMANIVELDIYIPDKNIAIEFNGLYWHSDKFKTSSYHYDKWRECKNKGIELVQIWEDDWDRNADLVKKMLANKLDLHLEPEILASDIDIVPISRKKANQFLNTHSVEGFTSGTYYLGSVKKKTHELVAVMVLKKQTKANELTLNIATYATLTKSAGGFRKTIEYAEMKYSPKEFIIYADNCLTTGTLFASNGFSIAEEVPPSYWFFLKHKRFSKTKVRREKVSSSALNSAPKIWDAGKTLWVRKVG